MVFLRRAIPLFLFIIFLALGVWLLGRLYFKDRITSSLPDMNIPVDLALEGVELVRGTNGTLAWRLSAKRAVYEKKTKSINLDVPEIAFYSKTEESPVLVSAPQGKILQEKNRATLWPSVEVVFEEYVLKADQMEYEGDKRLIYLKGKIQMTRPGAEMTAQRVMVDLEEEMVVAKGDVRAVFQGDPLQ